MSLSASPYENENIYDLTIRLYGNINGLSGLINNVNDLDSPIVESVEYEPIDFVDFVDNTEPVQRRQTLSVTIGESQSIYDLSLQLTGKLDGLSDIIGNYQNVEDELQGQTIEITKKKDVLLDVFLSQNLVFATRDSGIVEVSNWILANGFWNDGGIWIDGEFWTD